MNGNGSSGSKLTEAFVGGSLIVVVLGISTLLNSVIGIFQGDTSGISFILAVLAGACTVIISGITAIKDPLDKIPTTIKPAVTTIMWLFLWLILIAGYAGGMGALSGESFGAIISDFIRIATSLQALVYLVGVMFAYSVAGYARNAGKMTGR
jgi:hypothetical protein